MSIDKKMLEASAGWIAANSSVAPEGVDFDGANDYLSRSSDLTSNTDSKTFTFSAWVYPTQIGNSTYIYEAGANFIILNTSGYVAINDAGVLLAATTTAVPINQWSHILISCDMANTANRSIYVNDTAQTVTWTTYNDALFDFTQTPHTVGNVSGTKPFRLAHVYLDYTYRNLSTESNRRLFIDADLKPATGQASLSPILYLPMTDADTAHVNEGTGGNFTPNGTFATSQRGPNQNNCVASDFDGSADYLNSTSVTGAADAKVFTFSCVATKDADVSDYLLFIGSAAATYGLQIQSRSSTQGRSILIFGRNSAGTVILQIESNSFLYTGVSNSIQVSLDLTDVSKSKLFVNGSSIGYTSTTFTNDTLDFTHTNNYVGGHPTVAPYAGKIGEVYFDNTYTDLSIDNPFWDADANRPKPVRQVLDETGNTPLIAMPIEASNAGLNLGTGGNFTVNSGPYTGARGGSEFWARSIDIDGVAGSNLTGAMSGVVDGKEFTLMLCRQKDGSKAENLFQTTNLRVDINENSGEAFVVNCKNSAGTTILSHNSSTLLSALGAWDVILYSVDLANSKSHIVINNALDGSTATTLTNDSIDFTDVNYILGNALDGRLAGVYFALTYIDFSQEANRLKFVDAFNYPIDLQPAIDAADIPNPLVYMKFDDPSNLGLNSGTGGNFTVNGTVTAGSDVDPNA